jgi:hypothetical protein
MPKPESKYYRPDQVTMKNTPPHYKQNKQT